MAVEETTAPAGTTSADPSPSAPVDTTTPPVTTTLADSTTPPATTPPATTPPADTTTPPATTPPATTPPADTTTPPATTPPATTPPADTTTPPATTPAPGTTAPSQTTPPADPPQVELPSGPAAPATPTEVGEIVQNEGIPSLVVSEAPDPRAQAVAEDRIPSLLVSEAPEPGLGLDDFGITDTISGSADVGTAPTAGTLGDAFLDPAIPAAGAGVLDQTGGGDVLGDLAKEIVGAASDALAAVARLWADPPSPGIGTVGADGTTTPSAATELLVGSLTWYTAAVAVLAVLVAAGRMVWQRRSQPVADLLRGLLTLVLVGGAGVAGVTLLVSAADAFSVWILERATGDVEGGLVELLTVPQDDGTSVILTVLIGTTVLLGAVLQIVLLVARGAVLVVLAGVLPLTAAATNTDTGRAVFVRTLTWILAFTLYQPAAALVYSAAFLLPSPSDAPLVSALTGVTFLAMAIAALPALLRLLAPVLRTASASAGRHRAAMGGLPTGARTVSPTTVAGGAGGSASVRVSSTRTGGGPGSASVAVPGSLRMRPARLGKSTGTTVIDGARGAEPVHSSTPLGEGRSVGTVVALPGRRHDEEERVR